MKRTIKSWLAALGASVLVYGQAMAQDIATGLKQLDGNQACLAKETFEKVAAATPSADNQFYLGYFYLRTKQPDLAKAAFEKGLAADPKNQINKVGLGAVAMAKGDRGAANMAFDEAKKATKNKNVDVLFRIGEACTGFVVVDSLKPMYKTTDPAKAIENLDLAIALMLKAKDGQKNPDVYMAKGDAFFIKGESGPAVSAYEDAINANPNLGKAFAKIAKIYWGGRNYELAQTNFKKAVEIDPEYAPAYNEYAKLFFFVRQYKAASRNMDLYVEKLGACATDDDVLRNAQYNFVAEENAKVLKKLELVDQKSPRPFFYRMKGWSSYRANQYDKAVENLNKFIQIVPKEELMSNDYFYLGDAMLRINPVDTIAAIGNMERAAEMDTVDNIYKQIGAFYNGAKIYDKAGEYYEKAVKREKTPSLQDLTNWSLALYNQANRIQPSGTDSVAMRTKKRSIFLKTDEIYAQMIQRKPDYLYPYAQRAKANYYAYSREEAMENGACVPHMEKFIQLGEADKAANKANLVFCYQILGAYNVIKTKDDAKAKEYFTKLLELDPANKAANDYLNPPAPVTATPAPAATPAKTPATKPAPKKGK
ncbi:MAG: hypothetical protein MUE30_00610 [Spirosomaceae bacterium]|jgi:tetratricopeptide (TPR) repeat protein|nr:hypothetical protein [Spirosomataceae bacterium]